VGVVIAMSVDPSTDPAAAQHMARAAQAAADAEAARKAAEALKAQQQGGQS
jgi:hypothetical protein